MNEMVAALLDTDYQATLPGGAIFGHLRCPACLDTYVHFDADSYGESGHDNYDAPHGLTNRGDTLVIPLIGECGHAWNLVLGFHKGNMLLGVRDVRLTQRW